MIAVIVIVVIVIVLALFLVMTYNGMVGGRNKVDESWSGIDVQLKRRHDLVPNLVETVKGYATHEREVFQAVTDARTRAMSASTPAAAGAAEGQLGQALGRLFAVAEAYPDLKASQNFLELQGTLNQLESEIAASRRVYNSNVQTLQHAHPELPRRRARRALRLLPARVLRDRGRGRPRAGQRELLGCAVGRRLRQRPRHRPCRPRPRRRRSRRPRRPRRLRASRGRRARTLGVVEEPALEAPAQLVLLERAHLLVQAVCA